MILAVDPGTTESGYVVLSTGIQPVLASGVLPNSEMLELVRAGWIEADLLAIEMIASYGMPVGREVFETCVWIGRFQQVWTRPDEVRFVYRKDVKMNLCGTPRAKDGNVRQALIDRLGAPGTKANPGPTYGVRSHAWPALGVAVTAHDIVQGRAQ
jgi:hypothetical protein